MELLLPQNVFFLQKNNIILWKILVLCVCPTLHWKAKSIIFSLDIHDHQRMIPINSVCSSPIFNSWISVIVTQDVFVVWC